MEGGILMETTELIPSLNIQSFLQKRQDLLERFALVQMVATEMRQLQAELGGDTQIEFYDGYGRASHESVLGYFSSDTKRDYAAEALESFKKAIDRHAWKTLMEKSGAMTYMDSQARDDWHKSLQEGKYPELTYENIKETFQGLYHSRKDIFHRSVINVFKHLSWCYKTNLPFKFGKRLIKRGCYYGSYNSMNELDDLNRAFCILEGKPEPTYEQSWRNAIHYGEHTGFKENEYFALKWYKNGNGHITFKRMDLVTELNKILHIYFPNALAYDEREAA